MAEETLDPEHQSQGDTKEGMFAPLLPASFEPCVSSDIFRNTCNTSQELRNFERCRAVLWARSTN